MNHDFSNIYPAHTDQERSSPSHTRNLSYTDLTLSPRTSKPWNDTLSQLPRRPRRSRPPPPRPSSAGYSLLVLLLLLTELQHRRRSSHTGPRLPATRRSSDGTLPRAQIHQSSSITNKQKTLCAAASRLPPRSWSALGFQQEAALPPKVPSPASTGSPAQARSDAEGARKPGLMMTGKS